LEFNAARVDGLVMAEHMLPLSPLPQCDHQAMECMAYYQDTLQEQVAIEEHASYITQNKVKV
jgi:hypothetical protein